MSTLIHGNATLDDLRKVQGKAELIAGRIVHLMPTGHTPNLVAKRIVRRLDEFVEGKLLGFVYTDNIGFSIDPPLPSGRQTFSPDAAYFLGPAPADEMDFVEGAPTLAIKVRSKHDYGPFAEQEMAEKRADYFLAGTQVVWDVDPAAKTVTLYAANSPPPPVVFGPGDTAHAEPAVPGWTVAVDDLFQ